MNTDRWRDGGWEPPPPPWWPVILAVFVVASFIALLGVLIAALL